MSTDPTTHYSPAPGKIPLSQGERGKPRDAGAHGHARRGIAISIDEREPPPLPARGNPHATVPLTYDDEAGCGRHCYCCHGDGEPPTLSARSNPHATGPLTYDDEVGGELHCYCCHESQEKLRDAQTREREAVEQLKRDLEARDKESAKELADLTEALKLSQKKVDAVQVEREDIRRRWKQSTKELRQLTRPQHVSFQITDDDLVKWTMQLRLMVRDFTIRHFEHDRVPVAGFSRAMEDSERGKYHFLMKGTTPGTVDYEDFLASPSRCSSVVQAFVWHVLKQRVFTRFRWAEEVSKDAHALYRYFYEEFIESATLADPETIKRFKLWSVSTTALMMDCASRNTKASPHDPKEGTIFKSIVHRIHDVINPFAAPHSDPNACVAELEDILVRALAFDRDICRQAADVTWEFGHAEGGTFFDPATMSVERGERAPGAGDEVVLVVAPGVYKLGKSNGDGFEGTTQMVLRASVTCQEVEDGRLSGHYRTY